MGYILVYPRTRIELESALGAIQTDKAQGLELNSAEGYVPKSIDELSDFRHVKALRLGYVGDMCIAGIEKFTALEGLWCGYETDTFDLGAFQRLETLSFWAGKRFDIGIPLPRLRRLYVSKSRVEDCQFVDSYPKLDDLSLLQAGRLKSLTGITRAIALKRLQVGYTPKLIALDGIEQCEALRSLELGPCKAVKGYAPVFKATGLRKLIFSGCCPIESLSNLPNLDQLEHLAIIETDVLDGDLQPVLQLRNLKHFGVHPAKRHFHPSGVAVENEIANRSK